MEGSGDEIVAVQRKGLTSQQKARLALFDNRTAELADWNSEVVGLLNDIDGTLDGIFSENELLEILEEIPDFQLGTEDDQGKLDEKKKVTCPECKHEFAP